MQSKKDKRSSRDRGKQFVGAKKGIIIMSQLFSSFISPIILPATFQIARRSVELAAKEAIE